jgi:hypothetical protein
MAATVNLPALAHELVSDDEDENHDTDSDENASLHTLEGPGPPRSGSKSSSGGQRSGPQDGDQHGSTSFAARVGDLEVVSYTDGRRVPMRDFWTSSPCMLVFLRRFGCPLCRSEALEASALRPLLAKHGVRLVGIGMDATIGDFARYFTGELYRDPDQAAYKVRGGASILVCRSVAYASYPPQALGLPSKSPVNLLDPRNVGSIVNAVVRG